MTSSDWLNVMLTICAPVLAGILSTVLLKFRTKIGLDTTAQDKANMEAEISASIGAGIAAVSKNAPQILKDGVSTPALLHDVAAVATDYFKDRFPDRVAQIAASSLATGATDAIGYPDLVHAAVQQTIAARLPNINPPAPLVASPGQGQDGAATSAAPALPAPLVQAATA